MELLEKKQQIEFYLFMVELVTLLIEEYKQKPTGECFAAIDAMIRELNEWLIFIMKGEGISIEVSFPQLLDPDLPSDFIQVEFEFGKNGQKRKIM